MKNEIVFNNMKIEGLSQQFDVPVFTPNKISGLKHIEMIFQSMIELHVKDNIEIRKFVDCRVRLLIMEEWAPAS